VSKVMTKPIRRKRVQDSTDSGLIGECKKETQRDDCEQILWTHPSKGEEIHPPADTLAIVVDVVHNRGAMRIFEKKTDNYVSGVGIEDAGNYVIIPWDSSWWLRPSGSLRIGYVTAKPEK